MTKRQDLEIILTETLREITQRLQKIIEVDRLTIFLLDQQNPELCLILGLNSHHSIEMRIPTHPGLRQVANLKKFVSNSLNFLKNIHYSCQKDSKNELDYITYNLLVLPILNAQGYPLAFIQFVNKLESQSNPQDSLRQRVDFNGFTQKDEQRLVRSLASLRSTVERCQSLYAEIKKQRAVVAFIKAIHAISQGGLDLEATLQLIVDEAKELIDADRTTLWLIDQERHELWTKRPLADGSLQEVRLPIGVGFSGKVAESGKLLNIPFDLYIYPNSDPIKRLDMQVGYRTCSLLCMPVLNSNNELIGVMELVNKKKRGHFPDYNPDDWPVPPERFKASFSQGDQQLMGAFNRQVGIALQNAKLFTTLKQQEQIQRHIFRSLDKGVIYTDPQGRIITLNERAKQLLALSDEKQVEECEINNLIQLKSANVSHWFQEALDGNPQQYHPAQTLMVADQERQIDLSIHAIADTSNTKNLYGLLVILQESAEAQQIQPGTYRQISQDLTQEWLKEHEAKSLTSPEVSILCADIRGYTTLIEDMEPNEVVAMLNQYFELMVEAVFKYQGRLDHYIGDALIAIFGSSLPEQDRAWHGVQTALEMRQRLVELNAHHFAHKSQQLRIGIGIHSGKMSHDQIDASQDFPSDVINFTSLLERASLQYNCDIIISEATYRHCSDRIWVRELDCIHVKDNKQPVGLYELVGLRSQGLSQQQQQLIEHFHKGRKYYRERQFARSMSEFAQVLAINDRDQAARLHIQRCLYGLESPPPPDWDGVWTVTER